MWLQVERRCIIIAGCRLSLAQSTERVKFFAQNPQFKNSQVVFSELQEIREVHITMLTFFNHADQIRVMMMRSIAIENLTDKSERSFNAQSFLCAQNFLSSQSVWHSSRTFINTPLSTIAQFLLIERFFSVGKITNFCRYFKHFQRHNHRPKID